MRRVALGCLLLSSLSLLLPSEPSYDPWAWIAWGREAATMSLDTTGGPSWKPLPVLFTTFFAPAGAIEHGLPPALWLIAARTGALLALAVAFILARRLVPESAGARARLAGGLTAALALALMPSWLRYAAHGNEVPMAIALLLGVAERVLAGRHRQALACGVAACLLRPEAVPFVGCFGLWLWVSDASARPLLVASAALLPVAWLIPEWIGSGHPFDAGTQARSEPAWSLSRTPHPWLAVLERAHGMAGLVPEGGALLCCFLAWRMRAPWRTGAERLAASSVLTLATIAVAYVALIAAMTQAGFSGSPRYLQPALALLCVLSGVAVGGLVSAAEPIASRIRPGMHPAPVAGLIVAVLALGVAPWIGSRVADVDAQARQASRLAAAGADLGATVSVLGGPERVIARGAPHIERQYQTRLAWETRLTLGEVERARGRGMRLVRRAPLAEAPAPARRGPMRRPGCRRIPASQVWCVGAAEPQRGLLVAGGGGS